MAILCNRSIKNKERYVFMSSRKLDELLLLHYLWQEEAILEPLNDGVPYL